MPRMVGFPNSGSEAREPAQRHLEATPQQVSLRFVSAPEMPLYAPIGRFVTANH